MEDTEELELLAIAVHGMLAGLHLLGVLYNVKRRNWKSAWVHACAFTFDAYSVWVHYQAKRSLHERRQKPC